VPTSGAVDLEGAYRQVLRGVLLPFRPRHGFRRNRTGVLTTHRGRWVSLSLSLRDVLVLVVTFGQKTLRQICVVRERCVAGSVHVSEALTHGADGVPRVVLAAVRCNAGERRPVSWIRSANTSSTLTRPASRPWLVHVGIVIRLGRRVQAFSELQVRLNAIDADVLPGPRGLALSRPPWRAGTTCRDRDRSGPVVPSRYWQLAFKLFASAEAVLRMARFTERGLQTPRSP
jgi:hypothetical protein